MVGVLIRYLIIDLCITYFFDQIENKISLPTTEFDIDDSSRDDWSISVCDQFAAITVYKDNATITYRNCKIIDNHYESGCWFILIKYDSPNGTMNSTWIAYHDIIEMRKLSLSK